jgi:hypothetical protein
MTHGQTERRTLTLQICRKVVTQIAPEEDDLFPDLSEIASGDQPPALTYRDDALASGIVLDEALRTITPVIVSAATAMLTFVWEQVKNEAGEQAGDEIRRRIRSYFRSLHQPRKGTTATDIEKVRAIAYDKATDAGVSREIAQRIADSLVQALEELD